MFRSITIVILSAIAIAFPSRQQPAISREVSDRILQLAKSKEVTCDKDVPYCYLFKAIVDIDDGYLRVWATDELGTDYVVKQLYKGETVYVRQVFTYKGIKRAQLSVMREGCMVVSCSGSVDLRYLR
jgi:hypothetical protein